MNVTMQPSVVAVAFVAAIFVLAPTWADKGRAEVRSQLPPQLRSDPFIVELDKMLEEWNSARLPFPTKAQMAKEINARLRKIVTAKRYAYQTDDWARELRKRFDALADDLKPERKLTDPAALILMYLFVEGLGDFKRQVSPDKARGELALPLFMILGRAQEIAKSLDRPQIDSRILVRAVTSWWTAIWPFCD